MPVAVILDQLRQLNCFNLIFLLYLFGFVLSSAGLQTADDGDIDGTGHTEIASADVPNAPTQR